MSANERTSAPISLIVGRDLPPAGADALTDVLIIANDPADLSAHHRRLAQATDADEVYGALVDLFIGSDPEDQPSRVRALTDHRAQLDLGQYESLIEAAAHGLSPVTPIPVAAHSLLTGGATHTLPLVVSVAAVAAPTLAWSPDPEPTPIAVPVLATTPAPTPSAVRVPVATPTPEPPPARPRMLLAVAAIVIIVVGTVAFALTRSTDQPLAPTASAPAASSTAPAEPSTATDPASTRPAPTTSAPAPSEPEPATTPDAVAVSAVESMLAALDQPSGPWSGEPFAADSATAAEIRSFRDRLAAAGERLTIRAVRVDGTTTASGTSTATVLVDFEHDGGTLETPSGTVAWGVPGEQHLQVELVRGAGGWRATTISGAVSG